MHKRRDLDVVAVIAGKPEARGDTGGQPDLLAIAARDADTVEPLGNGRHIGHCLSTEGSERDRAVNNLRLNDERGQAGKLVQV